MEPTVTIEDVKKLIKDEGQKMFSSRLVGDTPTDANQLVPKKYVDYLFWAGAVDNLGAAIFLPDGWSSGHPGTGQYTVTHNLGTSSYVVVATIIHSTNSRAVGVRISDNGFTINIGNAGNTAGEDNSFNFILTTKV